jgi:hypothetical protein
LQLSAIRGPVKAIHPGAGTCQGIYTILYYKICVAGLTVEIRTCKRFV